MTNFSTFFVAKWCCFDPVNVKLAVFIRIVGGKEDAVYPHLVDRAAQGGIRADTRGRDHEVPANDLRRLAFEIRSDQRSSTVDAPQIERNRFPHVTEDQRRGIAVEGVSQE